MVGIRSFPLGGFRPIFRGVSVSFRVPGSEPLGEVPLISRSLWVSTWRRKIRRSHAMLRPWKVRNPVHLVGKCGLNQLPLDDAKGCNDLSTQNVRPFVNEINEIIFTPVEFLRSSVVVVVVGLGHRDKMINIHLHPKLPGPNYCGDQLSMVTLASFFLKGAVGALSAIEWNLDISWGYVISSTRWVPTSCK